MIIFCFDLMKFFLYVLFFAVSPLGSVMIVPEAVTVSFQESHTFTCTAKGGPDNEYQWLFDGSVINFPNEITTPFNSTLTISSVNADNGGRYTCEVENAGGRAFGHADLFVRPYNVIIRTNSFTNQSVPLVETVDGMEEILTCEAQAFPSPTFLWTKLTGPRSPQIVSDNATLSFFPVNFGDEGTYVCNASSNGFSANSVVVTVHGENYQIESNAWHLIP